MHPAPPVDELDFKSLYEKSELDVPTRDGWLLKITRYQPVPQSFHQPILGEPILLVHGFSQNRHAWTSGGFAKHLLYYGADLHILELRGHGKSSVALQREVARAHHRSLPEDIDWQWDLDSYLLFDLPAAVEAIRRATNRQRVFYCGHSMGGILGYGYAGLHDDLEGLVTIGSASDLAGDYLPLRWLARWEPLISRNVDAALAAINLRNQVEARVLGAVDQVSDWVRGGEPRSAPRPQKRHLKFRYLPMDAFLGLLERAISSSQGYEAYQQLSKRLVLISNPARAAHEDIRWLLRRGGEKEPRKVLAQFTRWIRQGEMKCYRTGYDFRAGFERIRIPMVIVYGDLDKLAASRSTRRVYRSAKSHYLVWRSKQDNSHLELTMGHDVQQTCVDIKNMIAHAARTRTSPHADAPARDRTDL